ncbi:Uncharacterized conserved protein YndB, AHSA1/START domain [Nakamurella panacisegetis]|uniref:Uncharacterized conserved protein YndB, AHSA1/START domain n=1 Tax=Nakamurella panacisegetis TaxID=1090615 RepID=A0A1H0I0E9_9ACTN|nr:SRPBCC family protein [Nakamurella panacisegetis]SDO24610.1 Uncharacterized conserved protein YndB, AHSA1/START domain [Nakamurella panacisegetis]
MATTSNAHQTVWTTPTDTQIVSERDFDAPIDVVFAAFTRPEHVQQWLLGPDGWIMPTCEIDLRVGGAWRYVWRNPSDGREFEMHGVYREIEPPGLIINTQVYEESESVNRMELTGVGGRTHMRHTMTLPSQEARDAVLATGMTSGADTSYDRLESYLAAR